MVAVPFTIEAKGATGSVFLTCSTASETLNRVLELEQRPHGSIIVRDGNRRSIDIDELTVGDVREATNETLLGEQRRGGSNPRYLGVND